MQKKSLLSQAQEAAAADVASPGTGAAEMTLVPLGQGGGALSALMSCHPLVGSVVESSGGGTPYIFGWWGTGNQQPLTGVKKGDLVLVTAEAQTKLEPLVKGFLCKARQQWCERVPQTSQLLKASLESQAKASKLEEEVEAMLLVLAPAGGLIPVTWRTRKGACRGLVTCMRELLSATTPEWPQQSEAHKLAARLPAPWMRFVVEIDHRLEKSNRPEGNDYPVTSAVCRPIDPDMLGLLKAYLAEETNRKLLAEVLATHEAKLKEVDQKLAA